MIKWLLISALLSIALFIQACAPQAKPEESCNFVQNSQGQRVSWKGELPIKLYIHNSFPAEYRNELDNAIAEWEESYGTDLFTIVGWTNGPLEPQQDKWNVIYWMTDWEENRQFEQARTSIYWVGDKIQEADIRINARDFKYFSSSDADGTGRVDFQSLMIHEFGHVLGLGHSSLSQTVMAATLANGVQRRNIEGVDVASLRCEY